jgi:hypothetical protein
MQKAELAFLGDRPAARDREDVGLKAESNSRQRMGAYVARVATGALGPDEEIGPRDQDECSGGPNYRFSAISGAERLNTQKPIRKIAATIPIGSRSCHQPPTTCPADSAWRSTIA